MKLYFLLGFCLLPAVLALVLFRVFMRGFRLRAGLLGMLAGILAIVPISVVQFFVQPLPIFNKETFFSLLATTFIFNGLIEEVLKFGCLFIIPRKIFRGEGTTLPFFACCLVAGLSIGGFESIIYLIKNIHEPFSGTALGLVVARMFTAVAIHTFCAGLSGLTIFQKNLAPLLFAIFVHGTYNFFAGFSNMFWLFSIVALLLSVLECRIFLKNDGLNN